MNVTIHEDVYTPGFINPSPSIPPNLSADTPGTLLVLASTIGIKERLYASFIPSVDSNTPILNDTANFNSIIVLSGTQTESSHEVPGFIPTVAPFLESVLVSGAGAAAQQQVIQVWHFS